MTDPMVDEALALAALDPDDPAWRAYGARGVYPYLTALAREVKRLRALEAVLDEVGTTAHDRPVGAR